MTKAEATEDMLGLKRLPKNTKLPPLNDHNNPCREFARIRPPGNETAEALSKHAADKVAEIGKPIEFFHPDPMLGGSSQYKCPDCAAVLFPTEDAGIYRCKNERAHGSIGGYYWAVQALEPTLKSPAYDLTPPAITNHKNKMTLPLDSDERKGIPMFRGCLSYFPAALAGVALTSRKGNDKHNPGEELHHSRGKSSDHADCVIRHLMDVADLLRAGAPAEQVLEEVSCLCWRALAYSQDLHEKLGAAPVAPAAKLPK